MPLRMNAYTALAQEKYEDYCVINLWEVEVEMVFERSLDTLLPFVPILKDGGNQQTVRRALVQLQQNEQLVEIRIKITYLSDHNLT
jgi:hypothetical protein